MVALAEARKTLGTVVDRVRYQGENVVLTANGKPAAVVVPIEMLELIERLEDARDVRALRAAIKAHKAQGGASKSLTQFVAERGL